ncbi:hypothetical protein EAG_00914 [Camponotus floridanus]|uniref:Uncharacterized protein n=1 Tax=Camponotus floridanus TaxID=104421 RepID=E2A166_CAMFO|nr:hypothetical protein EAG_00914 [Camponotus floridanus]
MLTKKCDRSFNAELSYYGFKPNNHVDKNFVITNESGDCSDQILSLIALDLQFIPWERSGEYNFLIPFDQLIQLLR